MAKITYRTSNVAPAPSNTVVKQSPLTNLEVDANFKSLDDDIQTRVPLVGNMMSFDADNGVISARDVNLTSDVSLKENVVPASASLVGSIKPVQFSWKDTGKISYGVIAQELEAVLPELVTTKESGIKEVSYIPMISLLIAAVQQLTAEVEQLKQQK